ncbi:MAG: hypothetical protein E7280_06705 [Lachnospiraceae bacterium]|nr:hypothetical protein [Lachnospiraceae bacterium]
MKLDIGETTTDYARVSSKTDITFTGKALKTPPAKRSGKTISWIQTKGCKYQIKIGKKIVTTKKTSYKTGGKVMVRAVKITNGIMKCSLWSKKI